MITKFSRMGRLPHFLSYGAPLKSISKIRQSSLRDVIWGHIVLIPQTRFPILLMIHFVFHGGNFEKNIFSGF